MRTLAIDFDGVIHSYSSGWKGVDVIPDPPTPGAIEWLEEMRKHYRVVIFTTRAENAAGAVAVRDWLAENGIRWSLLDITDRKPAAVVMLDDRALRFEGTFPSLAELETAATPWHAEPEQATSDEEQLELAE